ncbi:MAG: hypothetical protein KGZ75_13355 [Syntrophomonadaceae bacterium]|jgi:hypothetical protein|nr:hypothetical protein [Syntrophomonadaceae bacterium]
MTQTNSLLDELNKKIDMVMIELHKAGIAEYVEMMHRPGRVLAVNFLAGIARGIGMAIGFALLGALAIIILRKLVVLNLPVISDFIAELIKMVQFQMKL